MSYTEIVNCDLCDKLIAEEKNIQERAWFQNKGSKYHLELTNKRETKTLDLCYSCYKKCIKKINWKRKTNILTFPTRHGFVSFDKPKKVKRRNKS